jgi:hypothetical protein
VRKITFLESHHVQLNGRSTVALVRESLMLEARGSSNLFNIVNSLNCLKEYCLAGSVFTVRILSFLQNHPILVNGRSTVDLVGESSMIEERGSSTFSSIVNSLSF